MTSLLTALWDLSLCCWKWVQHSYGCALLVLSVYGSRHHEQNDSPPHVLCHLCICSYPDLTHHFNPNSRNSASNHVSDLRSVLQETPWLSIPLYFWGIQHRLVFSWWGPRLRIKWPELSSHLTSSFHSLKHKQLWLSHYIIVKTKLNDVATWSL